MNIKVMISRILIVISQLIKYIFILEAWLVGLIIQGIIQYFNITEFFRVRNAFKNIRLTKIIPEQEFSSHDLIIKIKKFSSYKDLKENWLVIEYTTLYVKRLVKKGYLDRRGINGFIKKEGIEL